MIIDFDGTPSDLQSKHDGMAADGDTLRFPTGGGTYSWSTQVTLTKGITLLGRTAVSGDHTTTITATDNTVILDNIPRNLPNTFILNMAGTQPFRLSGVTFKTGSLTSNGNNGAVWLTNTNSSNRVDNCHFDTLWEECMLQVWNGYGVIHHCVFSDTNTNNNSIRFLNDSDSYGDHNWNQPTAFGTSQFWFVEDCYFSNTAGLGTANIIDAWKGARYVVRYCLGLNTKFGGNHGTETPGRQRGGRAIECYNNTISWTFDPGRIAQVRSGVVLYYNNTLTGSTPSSPVVDLSTFRFQGNFPYWGQADGTVPNWDVIATESDGSHVDGHSPFVFTSGNATAGGLGTMTDSGKSFANYAGYILRNLTHGWAQYIISNTGTTITFNSTDDNGTQYSFAASDSYEVRKVNIAIDQPCRGGGDLVISVASTTGTSLTVGLGTQGPFTTAAGLDIAVGCRITLDSFDATKSMTGLVTAYSGTSMTMNATSVTGSGSNSLWNITATVVQGSGLQKWPNQTLEKSYSWNNVHPGGSFGLSNSVSPQLVLGTDYVNGSAMPGYTPYTYPHPLAATPPPPVAPSAIFSR